MTQADFGVALTLLRNRARLSIRDLAKRLDRESSDSVPYSTLGGWFSGSHLPTPKLVALLPTLLRLCDVASPDEIVEWLAAVERVRRVPGRRPNDTAIPFRGLAPYEPQHARYFFGRDGLTDELSALLSKQVSTPRPAIVVGPSGSGKSSLLRAGLIPRLANSGQYCLFTPGSAPLEALAQQLAELIGRPADLVATDLASDPGQVATAVAAAVSGGEFLIVVDQLEEIFTACGTDMCRRAFVTALCALADASPDDHRVGVRVALGLRADFYPQASRLPLLRDCLQHAQIVVGPMTEQELRAAITGPARTAKLTFEPGLVEVLLRDVAPTDPVRETAAGHEAGALPLLSHALLVTCRQSRGRSVTLAHYRATGGIQGAVSQTAEDAYSRLTTEAQRDAARGLFLRLVHAGDDFTSTTRRRVRYAEILDGRDANSINDIQAVLARFVDARLISANEDTVEISHEALLTAWRRLHGWLQSDATGQRIHRHLTASAAAWDESGQDSDSLYRGGRLAIAHEWADESGNRELLNATEAAYLATSVQEHLDQQRKARRGVRRRHQLRTVLACLVVVATGVTAYARQLQITNEHDAINAQNNARQSESRLVASEADRLRSADVPLAAQLALAAYRISPTEEARSSLLNSTAVPSARRLLLPNDPISTIAVSHDGRMLATGTDGGPIRLWTIGPNGQFSPAGVAIGAAGPIMAVAWSQDGSRLVAAGQDDAIWVWDTSDRQHPVKARVLAVPGGPATSVAISPDGAMVAAGFLDGTVRLWSLAVDAGDTVLTSSSDRVGALAFSPNGDVLAVGSDDTTVRLWRVSDPNRPTRLGVVAVSNSKIFAVAISPDGRYLAAGAAAAHDIYLWNISRPARPVPAGPPLIGPASWVNSISFSPGGTALAAASSDSTLWLFDLRTRRTIARLPQPSPVVGTAFRNPDSVVGLSDDGTVREWNVPGPVIAGAADSVFALSFDADGDELGIGPGSDDDTLTVWDPADTQHPVRMGPPLVGRPGRAAFSGSGALSPDGRVFAVGDDNGTVQLWNITDPHHPVETGLPIQVTASHELVESVAISPNGNLLAVSADDGAVHLLDIGDPETPRSLATLSAPSTGQMYSAAFDPKGTMIATAAADHSVYLWNIGNPMHPRLLAKLGGFTSAAYAVAFSRDGGILAAGSADGTVRLWRVQYSSRPVLLGHPLTGPVGYVYSVAFDPTTNTLATGNTDGTVWLWDVRTPSRPVHLATLVGPTQGVLAVAFAPNGRTLAAGGHDRTVRLWDTDPRSTASWICATTGTPITPVEWHRYVPDQPYDPPCR